MRIIAGLAKGKQLIAPKGNEVRPTIDRVKEAIFSSIAPYIQDSIVLDLFSGTGSLGIEALSRGAEKAYFVDNNKDSIKMTMDNVKNAGFKEKSHINYGDAFKVLKEFTQLKLKFDIIFMDPPYLKEIIIPCLEAIDRGKLLNNNGIIVIEHDVKDLITLNIGNLKKIKEKKYGNTMISTYSEEAQ